MYFMWLEADLGGIVDYEGEGHVPPQHGEILHVVAIHEQA